MPSYRLLAGCTTVIETFDAENDRAAIQSAHKMSLEFGWEPGTFAARWGYFRLERRDALSWLLIFAWVPRAPE